MPALPLAARVAQGVTIAVVMYAAIQLALYLGVEEKSWLRRWAELVTGGGVGLVAGVVFVAVFGAVGWVSGPVYGAIGLFGLAAGGALGGLGIGAILNVIRDRNKYDISAPTVLAVLLVGAVIAGWLARIVGRKFSPPMPPPQGDA
jgi:hypothetical protein